MLALAIIDPKSNFRCHVPGISNSFISKWQKLFQQATSNSKISELCNLGIRSGFGSTKLKFSLKIIAKTL